MKYGHLNWDEEFYAYNVTNWFWYFNKCKVLSNIASLFIISLFLRIIGTNEKSKQQTKQ